MDWFAPVRAYCERTGPDFWAEPVNALSNAGFLLAAAAAARRGSRADPPDRAALALAGLIAVVGIGSFLFHTLAVTWAMLADVIPIAVFVDAYSRSPSAGICGSLRSTSSCPPLGSPCSASSSRRSSMA
ncbi:Ceramidase [Methylobacterium phyllostachyos]|uniref:Ceramidase n=1 Tax=Methylobacterium phyllostachyos TaxID=582672 RepID=A0A1G9Z679_9HYPH|nr:Ceramidase [Methylobacterium phyllostachyos]